MHLARHIAHGLDGAGAAGHDARAQAAEIKAVELRVFQHADEHGGYAVNSGTALVLQDLHLAQGIVVIHQNDGGAMRQAAHHAQHAAEAVEQGHYDEQAVLLGQLHAVAQKLTVVGNVVVGKHHALGEAVVPLVYCMLIVSWVSRPAMHSSTTLSGTDLAAS